MEITFLGTGAGMPSKERNVSAIILNLLQENNSLWLFDCGEATQHQILHTKIKPRKINKIFITHLHGDHIFGLPGLLSSRSFLGGDSPLTIYGPKGIEAFVQSALILSGTHIKYPLHIIEIDEGVIFEDDDFIVSAHLLNHNIISYAYKIHQKDTLGELLVPKLRKLGIKPGPIYKEIKENEQTILPNGTIINRDDVLGPIKQGMQIAIFGDTKYDPSFAAFIQHVDVLVHEATFSAENESLAAEYYHTTTKQIATLAKTANVKKLICTHISSRYQNKDQELLLKEIQTVFPNSCIAADFDTFTIY